jgi:hypothetical protein
MAERSERRVARVRLPPAWAVHPDALDETVVHDPSGRPWLVCTSDRLYERYLRRAPPLSGAEPPDGADPADGADAADGPEEGALDDPDRPAGSGGRYETQVFYTARAGIRGFPTGHGQRFRAKDEALAGHRQWCLRVRTGEVEPDRVPDDPLDEQTT